MVVTTMNIVVVTGLLTVKATPLVKKFAKLLAQLIHAKLMVHGLRRRFVQLVMVA